MAGPPELMSALRSRGLRFTAQREQVLVAVRELGHATPEEVSARLPEVDLTTVYRTLQLLEEIGLLAHTHLGHGAPSYRPFDDHHIHLVCHQCGSVADADPGVVGPLTRRLADQQGFAVDLAHFTVFGQCARCAADAGEPVARERSASGRGLSASGREQSGPRAGTIGAGAAMT